jgi:hypothetical protein
VWADLREATVLVAGLGDLGGRTVDAHAALPHGRLGAAARDPGRARAVAGRAALIAELVGGAARVEAAELDLDDAEGAAAAFGRVAPEVIVAAASRHSWWRTPAALAGIPYGAWLPIQIPLVAAVTSARTAAAPPARVVALPHPDAVGPVLAPRGLAPDTGAGNVAEIAAKLRTLAAAETGTPLDEVRVRLVAHHSVEPFAFDGFGDRAAPETPPPVRAEIVAGGRRLEDEQVRALLARPYPLGPQLETHQLTAAATAATVAALLGPDPVPIHVPAPGGLPGGYPVLASRRGIELDLPADLSVEDARSVNEVAARWDGVERVDADGTLHFTRAVTELLERHLGLRLERVGPDEHEAVGAELLARMRAAA